jgi:hypothetical protein
VATRLDGLAYLQRWGVAGDDDGLSCCADVVGEAQVLPCPERPWTCMWWWGWVLASGWRQSSSRVCCKVTGEVKM